VWASTFVVGVVVALGYVLMSIPARRRARVVARET
jgi:hypothetical protein